MKLEQYEKKIKFLSGVIALILVVFSVLLLVVDGVAIVFTYASLVFALLSIGEKSKRILKVYGVLFIIAHFVLAWRVSSDSMHQNTNYSSSPMNFKLFEKCSNEMFSNIDESDESISPEQSEIFQKCINEK